MSEKVIIFGKSTWPYTNQARSAYGDNATYVDVVAEPDKLEEMLKFSKGVRKVPVIVEGKKVEIGYGGSWGVWSLIGDESQGYILLNPKSQAPNYKQIPNSNIQWPKHICNALFLWKRCKGLEFWVSVIVICNL